MIAYHFTQPNALRDGRPLPAVGQWLEHEGPIQPCQSGLHASLHPFDAMGYAPGPQLHRVELDGVECRGAVYVVARRRKILATIDATSLLRAFALRCASSVSFLWTPPDAVALYLLTGDESMRAAASTAAMLAMHPAADVANRAAMQKPWEAASLAATAAVWTAVPDGTDRTARRQIRGAQRAELAKWVDDAFSHA
jgi:hypothetical protein